MSDPHITREFFEFFQDLKLHNDRDWFQTNRSRYEQFVREPLLRFVREFDFRLRAISPHFVADARKNGGSVFRIHRDVRFSKDKSPYKTAAGVQFRHRSGKDVHAPGFYLHLEPGGCFVGMGIWRPDGPSLNKIRRGIVRQPERWRDVIKESTVAGQFRQSGDRLKRPPKGFPPEHPLVEDLKWKDYVVSRPLSDAEVLRPGFIDAFAADCSSGASFMRFLTDALGLSW